VPLVHTRRMAETAAHLVDHVFPQVPVRVVLSLPKRLRYFLHHEPALIGPVLRLFLDAVEDRLKVSSPGALAEARFGAVTFVHRFGSALNANSTFIVRSSMVSSVRSLRASGGSGRSRPRAGDRDGPCHAALRMQRLFYQLPKPPPEGQTVLSLTPMEFFERLATLIPPPRRHRHRYHGVLAPNAPLRAVVTSHAGLPMAGSAQGSSRPAQHPPKQQQRNHAPRQPICGRCYSPAFTKSSRCGAPAVGSRCD
jgi:hypothetical protein